VQDLLASVSEYLLISIKVYKESEYWRLTSCEQLLVDRRGAYLLRDTALNGPSPVSLLLQ
jgi:hypothetical protein